MQTLIAATDIRNDLRNVAIIAHVDHGKTTLVDHLLRQANTFRSNQVVQDLAMDSNDLERERGMTILAKHTGLVWQGTRINIIDTPGHADFSGEVERVINMADGCLLLIDAAEGPMPQTPLPAKAGRWQPGLRCIVIINKCDRPDARIAAVGVGDPGPLPGACHRLGATGLPHYLRHRSRRTGRLQPGHHRLQPGAPLHHDAELRFPPQE